GAGTLVRPAAVPVLLDRGARTEGSPDHDQGRGLVRRPDVSPSPFHRAGRAPL
ncbi:MAG: hypothetical protein AVDCRST_MAG15-1703, partial [uncultured Rubellimicrobium sp.]